MSWLSAFDKPEFVVMALMGPLLILLAYALPRTYILDRFEEILIGALIAMATVLIFVAVVHRYGLTGSINLSAWAKANGLTFLSGAARGVFNFLRDLNLTWAQELCIYMFVWMAKFGAAFGVRQGIHVGVDVLINQLHGRSRVPVVLFGLLSGALFTYIVGSLGLRFVWHIAHTDQTSADLEIPMWLVYVAVPIGSYIMSFRFLQVAFEYARSGDLPHHDHGHVDGLDDEVQTLPHVLPSGAKS